MDGKHNMNWANAATSRKDRVAWFSAVALMLLLFASAGWR